MSELGSFAYSGDYCVALPADLSTGEVNTPSTRSQILIARSG